MQEELEYCVNTEGGPKTGSVFALQGYDKRDNKLQRQLDER